MFSSRSTAFIQLKEGSILRGELVYGLKWLENCLHMYHFQQVRDSPSFIICIFFLS